MCQQHFQQTFRLKKATRTMIYHSSGSAFVQAILSGSDNAIRQIGSLWIFLCRQSLSPDHESHQDQAREHQSRGLRLRDSTSDDDLSLVINVVDAI